MELINYTTLIQPEELYEPQYLWAIIAGVITYIAGRPRRLAFIIATLGILAMDILHVFEVRGTSVPTAAGGPVSLIP